MADEDKSYHLNELRYYFDGCARNRLDRGSKGRRSSEVLAIRDRLMGLNEEEFALALKAIQKIVGTSSEGRISPQSESKGEEQKHQQIMNLIKKFEPGSPSPGGQKVKSV